VFALYLEKARAVPEETAALGDLLIAVSELVVPDFERTRLQVC
jgi:hypothetical protein